MVFGDNQVWDLDPSDLTAIREIMFDTPKSGSIG
jgi:hypothetical protein